MKLFEVELVRPIRLSRAPSIEDALRRMGEYRFREWAIGQKQEDITAEGWRNPSHTWLLSRRGDGVGVLQIKPAFVGAVIEVTERRKGIARQDSLGEVTYLLDRPGKIHLLAGGGRMIGQEMRGAHLYKVVCTAKDDVVYPFV